MLIEAYGVCPLYPFRSDCPVISLDYGIRITLDDGKFDDLFEGCGPPPQDIWGASRMHPLWVAQLPYQADKQNPIVMAADSTDDLFDSYTSQMERLVYCFVTALRLIKAGLVTPGPIAYFLSHPLKTCMIEYDWLRYSQYDYMFEEPTLYTLRQSDIPNINKLLANLLSWYDRRHSKDGLIMDVVLKRFHSAYRGEPAQNLIDQTIAFEALYLGDDKELSYKLALRSAYLLGRTSKKRTKIFNDIKSAYKLRNVIVHGGYKLDETRLKEIVPITEDYLRQSIALFLSMLAEGTSFTTIHSKLLDDIILRGNRSRLQE